MGARPIKEKEVAELVALADKYPVIGVVNMMGLPTPQVQSMRAKLRDSVHIRMTKKSVAKIILQQADKKHPGLAALADNLKGMPAFIFTKDNPFTLFKTLKKSKSTAPAKAGQIAPNDIVVPAGPTPFAPGPVIGELGAVGIKAGIDAGKVVIKEDSVAVKEGEAVPEALAGLLSRLGIEPMEIGLDLTAVYEGGQIFTKDILDVDEEQYISDIGQAHSWAFNLAMNQGVFTTETTELLVINAHSDAYKLAIANAIPSKETIETLLSQAAAHAASLPAE